MRRAWRRAAPLLAHTGPLIGVTIVVAGLQSALLIPVALLVQRVFDTWVPHRDEDAIVLASAGLLGLYLLAGALGMLSRGLLVRASKAAIADLRQRLLGHLYGLSSRWHDERGRGWVHGVVVEDTERVDRAVNQVLTQSGPAAVVAVALAAVALVLNPLLLATLLGVVSIMLVVSRRLGIRFSRRVHAWHHTFDGYAADVQVALRALPLTKAQAAEEWELERSERQLRALAESGSSLAWAQAAYTTVQGAVAAAAGVVVLAVGGIAVVRRSMTLGDLLSFYAVVALILRQVSVIFNGAPVVVAGLDAFQRIEEILGAAEPDPYRGTRRIGWRGGWSLEGVTFRHGDDVVLRDVDLPIQAGEHVALVGPNGAGKSTAVNLLLGLYRPTGGCVRADDALLDELDLRHLRRQIGVVLQDPVLLRGSVRENIAYGRAEATDAEIRTAAQRAGAAEFVALLADGYETEIGDDATRLSGGQRQRIALARALLGDPAALLLDEPTTYLDDAGIAALMATLGALPRRPTVVIVTHDLALTAGADRVVHLRDGRVVADHEPGSRAGASRGEAERT